MALRGRSCVDRLLSGVRGYDDGTHAFTVTGVDNSATPSRGAPYKDLKNLPQYDEDKA